MQDKMKNITEKLMIVRVSIHQWYPKKKDARALGDLAAMHNVDPERLGAVSKNLVDIKTIKPLQQRCRKLREDINDMTAPWEDGGLRALPAPTYFDFVTMLRESIQEIDALADSYAIEYETEITKAEIDLNGLYNADDYPSSIQMRNRFSVDYDFKPVPNASDVRVWGIGDDAASEIEKTVRESVERQVQEAQSHVVNQVVERAEEFMAKIKRYDEQVQNDVKGVRLYDSAVDNLRDVLGLVLSGLNFTGDQELAKLCKDLKKSLKGANAHTLRNSQKTRDASTESVEKVLNKFAGVYG